MSTDRNGITADYRRASMELASTLARTGDAELRRRSSGTRWTNEELMFHMVFGYMIAQALLPLVKIFGHLPPPAGRAFSRLLNAGTRPFDVVNYWGSRAAGLVYNRHRMNRKLERVTAALARSLARETEKTLSLKMAFPTRWDPFFAPTMTVAEVYAYPTLHFDFHARQLSLPFGEYQTPGQ